MDIITYKDAKALGLVRYFTGKPCKRGHIVERTVCDCSCVACSKDKRARFRRKNIDVEREKDRDYYKRNQKKRVAKSQKYRTLNPEAIKSQTKKYYEKNKAVLREKRRRYRLQNPEKVTAYMEEWRANNADNVLEYAKSWRRKNPEKVVAQTAIRRASMLNATPSWVDQKELLVFYDLAKQVQKMVPGGIDLHVDHIVPLRGQKVCGLHVPWNLQILEARENLKKGNSDAFT